MIDHQQLLFKDKKSFKMYKLSPFYELPNYDYIKLNKENTLDLMKESSRLIKPLRKERQEYINPSQKWIYRFFNKSLNIDIEVCNLKKFCIENDFNRTSIEVYVKLQKPYKGFLITRKLLKK